jgi:hypothetical protein
MEARLFPKQQTKHVFIQRHRQNRQHFTRQLAAPPAWQQGAKPYCLGVRLDRDQNVFEQVCSISCGHNMLS